MRKLIAVASVTVYVEQYKDEEGVEHMDVKQVGTGGLGNKEEYKLDWSDHYTRDIIFGDVGKYLLSVSVALASKFVC